MSTASLRKYRKPDLSKRLICSECNTLFASIDANEADKSFYTFELHEIKNWEIKAKWPLRKEGVLHVSNALPIVCINCKLEVGICQNTKVSLLLFRIRSVVKQDICVTSKF